MLSMKKSPLQTTFVTYNGTYDLKEKLKLEQAVKMENGTEQNGVPQNKDGSGENETHTQFTNPAFVKDEEK